jgi:hypothetical protein
MIAALALAAVAHTLPNERVFRLTVRGAANTAVRVKAEGPVGWLETLCTQRTCAIGHAIVPLSRAGVSFALLHVYRMREHSPLSATVHVRTQSDSTDQLVRFK